MMLSKCTSAIEKMYNVHIKYLELSLDIVPRLSLEMEIGAGVKCIANLWKTFSSGGLGSSVELVGRPG